MRGKPGASGPSGLDQRALDEEALGRIAEEVAARGPRLIRRTKTLDATAKVVALSVVLISGTWLFSRTAERTSTPLAPVVASAPTPQCSRLLPEGTEVGRRIRGGLEIPGRLALRISEGASFALSETSACRTEFSLVSGEIVVSASDLGGGTLVVRTPSGSVTVVGTVFAVRVEDRRLRVEVAEGKVAVEVYGARHLVEAGEALSESEKGVTRRAMAAEELEGLRGLELLPRVAAKERSRARPKPDRRVAKKDEARLRRDVEVVSESAEMLVRRARELKAAGELDAAREAYRQAGRLGGATAEAAWITLARLEVETKRAGEAIQALDEHRRLFPTGALRVEAAWIRIKALELAGDLPAARREATQLIERWPASDHARAAREWLENRGE